MLTLADLQNDLDLQAVAGFCPTSQQFIARANTVSKRLLQRGDWTQSLVPIRVCVNRGCVTWPRYVGEIRKINVCRRSVAVQNQWYEFMDNRNRRHWGSWCGGERSMNLQRRAPTYNEIYGPNCTVRLYPRYQADIGSTVTIFGIDNNGQPLQTKNVDGTWSDGITITAVLPFGSTSTFVSRIDRVVKSITQGPVNLYAYDSVANVLWDLAQYEPSETNPNYLQYFLNAGRRNPVNQTGQNCPETVIALIKLRHIDAMVPTDLMTLDNLGAYKFGFLALKAENAGSIQGGAANWTLAISELNAQLADESDEDATPIDVGPFRGNSFGSQACY